MHGGETLRTYQDLLEVGENEKDRMEFVRGAVNDHTSSDDYKIAAAAEAYYAKRNLTIEKFQKFLYNANGQAYPDLFSANYKLKTLFFRRFVIQQVQYVLSNGVTFEQESTKERLGETFDSRLSQMAKKAMVDKVAFGFWNNDHLEVFSFADTPNEPGFVPLYDADDGFLKAGIRYWSLEETQTKRYTLYELDGYTEYIQKKGEDIKIVQDKRPYRQTVRRSEVDGETVEGGDNYPGFPIIPMYANDLHQSELVGIRESIDCYDFVKSGLANEIDDNSGIYWVLKNSGGMDDVDIARFLDRMRTLRASVVDSDDGGGAEAHTLDVPYQAREAMLTRLRSDLYEDFQLVDMEKIMSGNLTATAIRMGYQNQDDKCGDFEYCIRDFIGKLLELLGIDDTPSFQWNRIANQLEETQMVLTAATYLDDEAILRHLPWLTPEEVDEILKRRDAEDMERLDVVDTGGRENEESDSEETDTAETATAPV